MSDLVFVLTFALLKLGDLYRLSLSPYVVLYELPLSAFCEWRHA